MASEQGELREFRRSEIADQIRRLGVGRDGVLVVHSSFRAVRPIEDGPLGLIGALRDALGPGGTLVMPSWTGNDSAPFDPLTTPSSADLGVVAQLFWRLTGVLRSNHPFAFAAAGPRAALILRDPLPLPPHIRESPIGRACEENALVLLIGVGHDANSTLHLAEVLAGVPYGVEKHCTVKREGRPFRIQYRENDHCCARFALADEWLRERNLQTEGNVGHAQARLVAARDIIAVALEKLSRDPLVFLHRPEDGCSECDEARRSLAGPTGPEPASLRR